MVVQKEFEILNLFETANVYIMVSLNRELSIEW